MTSLTHAHTHHDGLEAADEEAEAAALLNQRVADDVTHTHARTHHDWLETADEEAEPAALLDERVTDDVTDARTHSPRLA